MDYQFGKAAQGIEHVRTELCSGSYHAVIVSDLVADAAHDYNAFCQDHVGPLLQAFVRAGGVIAFITSEGLKLQESLQYLFGVRWKASRYTRAHWQPASPHVEFDGYRRSSPLGNNLHKLEQTFGAELAAQGFSAKACSVTNVPLVERGFGEVINEFGLDLSDEGRRRGGLANADECVDMCIAVRSYGRGAIAYFGDVNCSEPTLERMAAFCRRRSPSAPVQIERVVLPLATDAPAVAAIAVPRASLPTVTGPIAKRKSRQLTRVIENACRDPEWPCFSEEMEAEACLRVLGTTRQCDRGTGCPHFPRMHGRTRGFRTTACPRCMQVRYCDACAPVAMPVHDCPGEAAFHDQEVRDGKLVQGTTLRAHPAGTRVILRDRSGRTPPRHIQGIIVRFVPGMERHREPYAYLNGMDDELPHYGIEPPANDIEPLMVPCVDVHHEWELVAPRLYGNDARFTTVDSGCDEHTEVLRAFTDGWRHDEAHPQHPPGEPHKSCATVIRIVRIHNPPELRAAFEAKQAALKTKLGAAFVARRLFHGTGSRCSFGIDPIAEPCSHDDCVLCNICCNGFRSIFSARSADGRSKFERFGHGLYFSSTSSKSDDYNRAGRRHARRPQAARDAALRRGRRKTLLHAAGHARPCGGARRPRDGLRRHPRAGRLGERASGQLEL